LAGKATTVTKKNAAKKKVVAEPKLEARNVNPEVLDDEISSLIAKFKPPKAKEYLLRQYILEAHAHLYVHYDFDDLDLIARTNDKIAQEIRRATVILSNALEQLLCIPDLEHEWGISIDKIEDIKSDVRILNNRALDIPPAPITKRKKGRKAKDGWLTVIFPLASGYSEVFGKEPTVSNSYNSVRTRSEFCKFVDAAIKVITGQDVKLKPTTLNNNYLKKWKVFKKKSSRI
jgi:hypothetical protein